MLSLYEKQPVKLLADGVHPTDTAADPDIDTPDAETLAIGLDPLVIVHVGYQADGSGKTLRLFPEVRLTLPSGDHLWVPAMAAIPDVAGASVDATTGLLPLPHSSPIPVITGIDGVNVLVTLRIPVPTGERFRLRYLETGYDSGHLAELTLLAAAARGAS